MNASLRVRSVLEKLGKALMASEMEPALEIAYLAMAADRSVRDEEYEAFEQMVGYVAEHILPDDQPYRRSQKAAVTVAPGRAGQLFDRFAAAKDRDGAAERLAAAAAKLPRPAARDFAFQLAYLMFISDFDTNDSEVRFENRARRALELSDDWSESLVDELLGAVGA